MQTFRIPHEDYTWTRSLRDAYGPFGLYFDNFATVDGIELNESGGPTALYGPGFAERVASALAMPVMTAFVGQIREVTVSCLSSEGFQGAMEWAINCPNLHTLRINVLLGSRLEDLYQSLEYYLQWRKLRTLEHLEIKMDGSSIQQFDLLARTLSEICRSAPRLTHLGIPLDIAEAVWSHGSTLRELRALQTLVLSGRMSSLPLIQPTFASMHLPSLTCLSMAATFAHTASVVACLPGIQSLSLRCDSPDGMSVSLTQAARTCGELTYVSLDIYGSREQRHSVDWRPLLHCPRLETFHIAYPYTLPIRHEDLELMLARWSRIYRLSLNPFPLHNIAAPALPLSSLLTVAQTGPRLCHLEALMDCINWQALYGQGAHRSWESLLTLQLGASTGRGEDLHSIATSIIQLFPRVEVQINGGGSPWVRELGAKVRSLKGAT